MSTGSFLISGQSSEGASGSGSDDGDGGDKKDEGAEVVIEDKAGVKTDPAAGALTQVIVPDVFPEVPVLPVHRNPVFPRFVKMMEVCQYINRMIIWCIGVLLKGSHYCRSV